MHEHSTALPPGQSTTRRTSNNTATRWTVVVAILALSPAYLLGPLAAQQEPVIPNIVEQIKKKQEELRTLTSRFVQHKTSELFIEPEISYGTFAYVAPDQVRWEYTEPNEIVVVVNESTMLTWYRDLGRAERLNVGRQADRILQFLSTANSLATLQRYFTMQIAVPKNDQLPYELTLTPRFKRVEKRITSMTIHIDKTLYVPVLVRYQEPTGDTTEYRFEDVTINEDVAPALFELELPEGTEERVVQLGEKNAE